MRERNFTLWMAIVYFLIILLILYNFCFSCTECLDMSTMIDSSNYMVLTSNDIIKIESKAEEPLIIIIGQLLLKETENKKECEPIKCHCLTNGVRMYFLRLNMGFQMDSI